MSKCWMVFCYGLAAVWGFIFFAELFNDTPLNTRIQTMLAAGLFLMLGKLEEIHGEITKRNKPVSE